MYKSKFNGINKYKNYYLVNTTLFTVDSEATHALKTFKVPKKINFLV